MKVALIPARGGSKRIPGKNIKSFCGKPIIHYSIEAALNANCFDEVIVSTDSEEIAEVARAAGARIPYMRPAELSDDHATTMDVLRYGLEAYKNDNKVLEAMCCIYATAPFVTSGDLESGYRFLVENDVDYVFSACEYPFPIQRAFSLTADNRVELFQPLHQSTRSQDLITAYHDAGQFYWCRPDAIEKNRPIFSERSVPVLMQRQRVQDIDTPDDWAFAQALFEIQNKEPT